MELRIGARREANTRATVVELFDGLEARSQNRWPSLAFDLGAVNSALSSLIVAGFYYKTFMWPSVLWEKLYEPAIRRAAGLGHASHDPDPDTYERTTAFCDVLVIGSGPAGLAAALAAGRAGARVMVCEEDFLLGGRLNAERYEIDRLSGTAWAQQVEAELSSLPCVTILRRTTVFGAYDAGLSGQRTFGALERVSDHLLAPRPFQPRQRLWRIIAKRAVLAAGAIERPIVFAGNDCPGVMLASAARTYLNRFATTPGRRVALFTSSDDGWRTARDFADAGVPLQAVVDARASVDQSVISGADVGGERVMIGAKVVNVDTSHGSLLVTIRDGKGKLVRLPLDALNVAGGWNPNLALSTHLGGRPLWSQTLSSYVPADLPRGMSAAGASNGALSLASALREGAVAGSAAAKDTGYAGGAGLPRWHADDEAVRVTPLWFVAESNAKAFVDLQNDVTRSDIELAAREGYRSVELLKRYTTLGMATDQGKTSNLNGHAIVAALTGSSISEVGTTVSRPPYTPVAIAAFAGGCRDKQFRPTRVTSGHGWARERRATFVEAGHWLRAQYFPIRGETDYLATVSREVKAARTDAGVCDVSTLGKIDIQGEDAAVFLDRIYINSFSTLPVGKVRYGLMLREDGFVLDDGTCAHLSKRHYVMSTTTAHADKVMQHLDHARQVLWPKLDVQLAPITEQWSQYAIVGPKSRSVLQQLLGDAIDLSPNCLPFLACANFSWDGIPTRIFRISFSGELAYELAVPARYGDAVIRAIMAAGEEFGITPYGTEAIGVMRIEKGYIAGNEINGTTTAEDLGFARMMSKKKDFIGRVLAGRPGLTDPDRAALVGVRPLEGHSTLCAGGHLVDGRFGRTLEASQGYVTSSTFSPTLGHWIGLGLLKGGLRRLGERLIAHNPLRGGDAEVEVVTPIFFDPDGARLQQ